MNNKGMTLIELIVVVSIVAIVSAIAMMSMGDLRQTYAVKAAAREIYGDLQRARLAAIRGGRDHYLCFSPSGTFTSYALHSRGSNNVACDADDNVLKTRDIALSYGGMIFTENFSGASVSFSPNGKASSGNVTVVGGKSTKVVTVNGNTGNIRIQ